jgi:hypothetical protein
MWNIQQELQGVSFAVLNDRKRCILCGGLGASGSRNGMFENGAFHVKLNQDPSTTLQTGIVFQKYPKDEAPRMTRP